jgi:hypothetical protein
MAAAQLKTLRRRSREAFDESGEGIRRWAQRSRWRICEEASTPKFIHPLGLARHQRVGLSLLPQSGTSYLFDFSSDEKTFLNL